MEIVSKPTIQVYVKKPENVQPQSGRQLHCGGDEAISDQAGNSCGVSERSSYWRRLFPYEAPALAPGSFTASNTLTPILFAAWLRYGILFPLFVQGGLFCKPDIS